MEASEQEQRTMISKSLRLLRMQWEVLLEEAKLVDELGKVKDVGERQNLWQQVDVLDSELDKIESEMQEIGLDDDDDDEPV